MMAYVYKAFDHRLSFALAKFPDFYFSPGRGTVHLIHGIKMQEHSGISGLWYHIQAGDANRSPGRNRSYQRLGLCTGMATPRPEEHRLASHCATWRERHLKLREVVLPEPELSLFLCPPDESPGIVWWDLQRIVAQEPPLQGSNKGSGTSVPAPSLS